MILWLNLRKDPTIFMKLSDYRYWLSTEEYEFLPLYYKVIQILKKKEVDLSWIYSYVFINEVSNIKKTKYIRYIIFPWNEENKAEELIRKWGEFTKSKKFEYSSVKLIWYGMNLKDFMRIYSIFIKKNVIIHICSTINLKILALILK